MYTMQTDEGEQLGWSKDLVGAVMKIYGVKDANVFNGRRLVAFWCSARQEVRAGNGANDLERKSLGFAK